MFAFNKISIFYENCLCKKVSFQYKNFDSSRPLQRELPRTRNLIKVRISNKLYVHLFYLVSQEPSTTLQCTRQKHSCLLSRWWLSAPCHRIPREIFRHTNHPCLHASKCSMLLMVEAMRQEGWCWNAAPPIISLSREISLRNLKNVSVLHWCMHGKLTNRWE